MSFISHGSVSKSYIEKKTTGSFRAMSGQPLPQGTGDGLFCSCMCLEESVASRMSTVSSSRNPPLFIGHFLTVKYFLRFLFVLSYCYPSNLFYLPFFSTYFSLFYFSSSRRSSCLPRHIFHSIFLSFTLFYFFSLDFLLQHSLLH